MLAEVFDKIQWKFILAPADLDHSLNAQLLNDDIAADLLEGLVTSPRFASTLVVVANLDIESCH